MLKGNWLMLYTGHAYVSNLRRYVGPARRPSSSSSSNCRAPFKIKDGIDLSTSAGRLMANVLASVAQYETEIRGERVAAGQAVARAKG